MNRKRNRASDIPKVPHTRYTKIREFIKQNGNAELVADCLRLLGIPACFMKHPSKADTDVVMVEGDWTKGHDLVALDQLNDALAYALEAPTVSTYINKALTQGGYRDE